MKYNPKIHHRRSIRLMGYDYSKAGLYFITICCQHQAYLFREIDDGEMVLNDAGKMVEHWYNELQYKFKNIKCREMVIMPNHFHCIIEIVDMMGEPVGANLCVCPGDIKRGYIGSAVHDGCGVGLGEHAGVPLHGGDDGL